MSERLGGFLAGLGITLLSLLLGLDGLLGVVGRLLHRLLRGTCLVARWVPLACLARMRFTGFGLTLMSRNPSTTFVTLGAIYVLAAQAFGFAAGGHVTGRLIGPAIETKKEEEMRAGAHGQILELKGFTQEPRTTFNYRVRASRAGQFAAAFATKRASKVTASPPSGNRTRQTTRSRLALASSASFTRVPRTIRPSASCSRSASGAFGAFPRRR